MKKKSILSFFAHAEKVSNQLKANDQIRTGRGYMTAIRRLAKFTGTENILFSDLTPGLLNQFQITLRAEGLAMNTISFYMRNLRVLYNRAFDSGLIKTKDDTLFKKVFTGTAETVNRALTKKELAIVSCMNKDMEQLQNDKKLYESQLYFSFCVHGRGISFIDMCFLQKTHIRNGAIYYFRKKTRQQLVVKITEPMQEILDYFSNQVESSSFLFPLLDEKDARSLRAQYENILCKQNRRLKVIGKLAGLSIPLSTHVARHTWATIAYQGGIALNVVSQSLGHRDERTTAIYLAAFEKSVLDKTSDIVSGWIMEEQATIYAGTLT